MKEGTANRINYVSLTRSKISLRWPEKVKFAARHAKSTFVRILASHFRFGIWLFKTKVP